MDRLEGVHAIRHQVQLSSNQEPQPVPRPATNGHGEIRQSKAFQQSA